MSGGLGSSMDKLLDSYKDTTTASHFSLLRYVTVDESRGAKLYYYFVLSERNPSEDPVVLWLNGGPGCSSFDGFVYEHGPFNFERTQAGLPKLHLNKYSWSKVSNIIYLDSPVGIGLSYSEKYYEIGDMKTASDTHKFLLKWFKLYPEFLSNPFFLSGESYAGVYIPTLAYKVVKGIDAGVEPTIKFEGYMVGNGLTDEIFDGNGLIPFVHGMGLISDQLYQEVHDACHGNYYNPSNDACEQKLNRVDFDIRGVYTYDILASCYSGEYSSESLANKTKLPVSFRNIGRTERSIPVRTRMFGRVWPLRAIKDGIVPTWPQVLDTEDSLCTDDKVATLWLNDAAVREAIHAEPVSVAGSWELCKGIDYDFDAGSTMIKYHKYLTSRGFRALIYSGDHDMCIPFTGTEAWTRSLGYKIVDEWRPWWIKEEVAGFIQGYDNNLTFLTIKGAGHTVPEYKPKEALAFYSRWLAGKKI